MNADAKQRLRDFLQQALRTQGDPHDFADDESLFLSGRLDSFSMMNLVMRMEQDHGIEFSAFEFDVNLIDSVHAIETFVDTKKSGGGFKAQAQRG